MTSRLGPAGEAVGFLTIGGGASVPSPSSVRWFPLVGALIGAALAAIWWAADQMFSPLVSAVIVITADAAITGMLHFDGLADSADGLLPHMERSRRLEVMSAPDIGAFALVVVVLVLLLRVGAVASMELDTAVVAGLIALWSTSRAAMGSIMRTVPYARSSGLASAFARPPSALPVGVIVAIGAVGIVALDDPGRQVLRLCTALAGAVVAAIVVALVARRRLGGYTGDVLGAAGVVAETMGLIVLSANW
ncbi:MAG: adenosylcobinamide-GDP ribazoletransferase [Acidimicrobiia bacterium]